MTLQAKIDRGRTSDPAALLEQYREEFAMAWAEAVRRQLPGSSYARLPWEEFRAAAIRGIDTLLRNPVTNPDVAWPETGITSPRYLLKAGFGISEVFQAALLALEVFPAVIRRSLLRDVAAEEAAGKMSTLLRGFLGGFVAAFAAEALGQVHEEQQRTTMILEAARAASSTLDLKEVLRSAAAVLAAATGTTHCWFYLIHKDGKSGGTWAATDEPNFARLSTIEPPTGLLSQIAHCPEGSVGRRDTENIPRTDNEWAERHKFGSALVVPLMMESRALGVAVAVSTDIQREFTTGQIELAQGIANVVAPAIENARLYRKTEKIAVMEERLRLARELHDNMAQALGYLSMKTAITRELLAHEQIDQAETELAEVGRTADEAYSNLREAIFCLRTSIHSGPKFWPALREYLAEYQTHYGVDARLVVDEDSSMMFSPKVGAQLSRIILEALTNVRKHSKAGMAWVRVESDGNRARVTIEDDGQGFDVARVIKTCESQIGLQIMRERAQSIGGTLKLDSGPDLGTRVVVEVPIAEGV